MGLELTLTNLISARTGTCGTRLTCLLSACVPTWPCVAMYSLPDGSINREPTPLRPNAPNRTNALSLGESFTTVNSQTTVSPDIRHKLSWNVKSFAVTVGSGALLAPNCSCADFDTAFARILARVAKRPFWVLLQVRPKVLRVAAVLNRIPKTQLNAC